MLDLTQHPAAPPNQTLVASNQLICATVDQLNAFAATCESKLLKLHHKVRHTWLPHGGTPVVRLCAMAHCVSSLNDCTQPARARQMQRLETEVKLLECKLNSLPPSASDPPPAAITGPPAAPATPAEPPTSSSSQPPGATDASQPATAPTAPPAAPEPEPEPEPTGPKVKEDPRFIKYFKMLNFGVPPPVVAAAFANETGFPASLLDTPNAPAPPQDAEAAEEDE